MLLLQALGRVIHSSMLYYTALVYFALDRPIIDCPLFQGQNLPAVHMFTLAKALQLWNLPHYRAHSLAEDFRQNLRNVAIPGTGVPLSVFCINRATYLLFILLVNPLACLVAACYLVWYPSSTDSSAWSTAGTAAQQEQEHKQRQQQTIAGTYHDLLLQPQHWFAIWRHNCMLMGYHELVTGSSSYRLEDKGTFLLEGDRLGLPVSPFFRDAAVFVKHKSIEGGMGIHVYRNFAQGGDWIIQKALNNSSVLASMLPAGAPLSTMRVVTASIAGLQLQGGLNSSSDGRLPNLLQQQDPHSSSTMWQPTQEQLHGQRRSSGSGRPLHASMLHHHRSSSSRSSSSRSSGGGDSHGQSINGGLPQQGQQQQQDSSDDEATTPLLPMSHSVSVLRRLNVEGRAGQFVDAVRELKQKDLADPALQDDTGAEQPMTATAASMQQQQHNSRPKRSSSAGGGAAAAAISDSAQQAAGQQHFEAEHAEPQFTTGGTATCSTPASSEAAYAGLVEVVTAVWRAGLAGAETDHTSICFSIDSSSGQLGRGVTANHWYRLGLKGFANIDAAASKVWTTHPDTDKHVTGRVLPGLLEVLSAVVHAHMVAAPDLPLVGWDVALTPDGVFILEVNLSCNLFNGSFDRDRYYSRIFHYLAALQECSRQAPAPSWRRRKTS